MINLQKYSNKIAGTKGNVIFMTSDVFDKLASNNERINIDRNISEIAFYKGELNFDKSFDVLAKFSEIEEPLSSEIMKRWYNNPFEMRQFFEEREIAVKLVTRRMTKKEHSTYLNELKSFR